MKFRNIEEKMTLLARDILNDKIDPVEGCRIMCNLADSLGDLNNEIFRVFQAIESETDHFLIGSVREYCDPEYLKRIDREKHEYLVDMKKYIFDECQKIIDQFQKCQES